MKKDSKNKGITRKKASGLATLLAGLSLACAPVTQQRSYSPEDNQVSPELLQEFADSVDSYLPRLEQELESSDFNEESLFRIQVRRRIESLGKVRGWLNNYDGSPLNPLEKYQVEMVAREFIGTSRNADINPITSDLELIRETGAWGTYADILDGVSRRDD